LREVGLVEVRDVGRQRLYRLNGRPLRPIYDWVRRYERTWEARFDRLDAVLSELQEENNERDDQQHGRGEPADRHADPDHP
jgi:DNA-binding transcriptional ArsR family regulator